MAIGNEVSILVKAEVDKAIKNINKVEKTTKKSTKTIGSTLSKLKMGYVAVAAGIATVLVSMKKLVDLAGVQEKAERTLAAAMKQAGTYTKEAFEHNLKYASSLQKMTTYGDEAILGVQKLLTNFGIEGKALDDLTKATLDLAAAKGMDLTAAADLVAKSVGSSTNALSRYGIQVTGAVGSTERMQMAVQNITKLFGGAAAAEAATYAGRLEQFKNVLGDLGEKIGFLVLPAITKILISLTDLLYKFEGVSDKTKDFIDKMKEIKAVQNIMAVLVGIFKVAWIAIKQMLKPFILIPEIIMMWKSLGQTIIQVVKSVATLGSAMKQVLSGEFKAAVETAKGGLSDLKGAFANNAKAVKNLYKEAFTGGGIELVGIIKETKNKILSENKKTNDEIKKSNAETSQNNIAVKTKEVKIITRNLKKFNKEYYAFVGKSEKELKDDIIKIKEELLSNIEKLNDLQLQAIGGREKATRRIIKESAKQIESIDNNSFKKKMDSFNKYASFVSDIYNQIASIAAEISQRELEVNIEKFEKEKQIHLERLELRQADIDSKLAEIESDILNELLKYETLSEAEQIYQDFLAEKELERYNLMTDDEKKEYDLKKANDDAEKARLLEKDKKEKELRDKKANDEKILLTKKAAIELEYENKVKAEKKEAFKKQKAADIVSAIIKGHLGAVTSIAQWGLPWGLIPAGAAITFGAVQAALIASKETPSFATGGTMLNDGMALVGEQGAELVNLPRGANVINNTETKKYMNNKNLSLAGANITVMANDPEELLEQIENKINNMGSSLF